MTLWPYMGIGQPGIAGQAPQPDGWTRWPWAARFFATFGSGSPTPWLQDRVATACDRRARD